jgi:hypothetical protein
MATLLFLALSPLALRPAAAQDATAPASGDTELAPQLPAVDLPTMNEMGYTFQVDSAWDGSGSTPQELPIYQYTGKTYTEDEVKAIADTLKIGGDITSQGEGTFTVTGDGSIFTTPGMLQYTSSAEAPDEDVPSDDESIATAREWLRTTKLLPANSGDGTIIARIDSPARKVVSFQPSAPTPILSTTPGVTVTVGPGGTVLEARISWANITEGDMYRLRGEEDAFGMIESRQSYLDLTLPQEDFPQGTVVKGSASYGQVSIAWATSGVQGDAQYLQPVYVLTGTFTAEGSDATYDITAYVPAIVTSLQPVG